MSRFCLDTSAYSRFKCNHAPAVEAVSTARWLGVPVVVLGELRTGFLLGSRTERNETDLRSFLANPVVAVLDLDDEASRIYAEIAASLRRAGRPIPTNDLWIAAVAVREGATLLTYDPHFEAIPRIGVRVLS